MCPSVSDTVATAASWSVMASVHACVRHVWALAETLSASNTKITEHAFRSMEPPSRPILPSQCLSTVDTEVYLP